jgi:hypothetical protein
MKATKRKNKLSSSGIGVRARRFMESNPAAAPNEVAARFNTKKQYIYVLRSMMKKEGFVFPKKSEQLATLAPVLPIEMYDDPWQPPEMLPMPEVDATLDARALDYGKFIEGAEVMQMLKRVVQNALSNRDKTLAHDQAEAMDMIIHKIGRIINGNPDVVDHWLDIAGYAQLVADRLNGRIR